MVNNLPAVKVCYTKVFVGGILDGLTAPAEIEIPAEKASANHWVEFWKSHDSPEKPVKPCAGNQQYWIKDFRFEF